MKQIVIPRGNSFLNDGNYFGEEDINTLGAKVVFEGLVIEFDEVDNEIVLIDSNILLLNYDTVKDIETLLYVRESSIKPGTYHEIWREPNEKEWNLALDEITELLKINFDSFSDLKPIEAYIKSFIRDNKLNKLGI
jgi:hypothetical protein